MGDAISGMLQQAMMAKQGGYAPEPQRPRGLMALGQAANNLKAAPGRAWGNIQAVPGNIMSLFHPQQPVS